MSKKDGPGPVQAQHDEPVLAGDGLDQLPAATPGRQLRAEVDQGGSVRGRFHGGSGVGRIPARGKCWSVCSMEGVWLSYSVINQNFSAERLAVRVDEGDEVLRAQGRQ